MQLPKGGCIDRRILKPVRMCAHVNWPSVWKLLVCVTDVILFNIWNEIRSCFPIYLTACLSCPCCQHYAFLQLIV